MGNCCNILFHLQLRTQLYARVPRTVLEARGWNHLQLHQMLQPPLPPPPMVSNTFYHVDSDGGWKYLLLSKNNSLKAFCPKDSSCNNEIKKNMFLCLILVCCPSDEQNCPLPLFISTVEGTTVMYGTSTTAAATRASTVSIDATTSSGIMASAATFLQGKIPILSTK